MYTLFQWREYWGTLTGLIVLEGRHLLDVGVLSDLNFAIVVVTSVAGALLIVAVVMVIILACRTRSRAIMPAASDAEIANKVECGGNEHLKIHDEIIPSNRIPFPMENNLERTQDGKGPRVSASELAHRLVAMGHQNAALAVAAAAGIKMPGASPSEFQHFDGFVAVTASPSQPRRTQHQTLLPSSAKQDLQYMQPKQLPHQSQLNKIFPDHALSQQLHPLESVADIRKNMTTRAPMQMQGDYNRGYDRAYSTMTLIPGGAEAAAAATGTSAYAATYTVMSQNPAFSEMNNARLHPDFVPFMNEANDLLMVLRAGRSPPMGTFSSYEEKRNYSQKAIADLQSRILLIKNQRTTGITSGDNLEDVYLQISSFQAVVNKCSEVLSMINMSKGSAAGNIMPSGTSAGTGGLNFGSRSVAGTAAAIPMTAQVHREIEQQVQSRALDLGLFSQNPKSLYGAPADSSNIRHTNVPRQPGQNKKMAVLIGCNYPGTKASLQGCVNDVLAVQEMLQGTFGFRPEDITVMIDTDKTKLQPTGANIKSKISEMVQQSADGDSLVIHFSGHGTQIPCKSGDEKDMKDEAICPCDMNVITDDDLKLLLQPLSLQVKLTFMADCCHSGTLLDHDSIVISGPKPGGPPPPSVADIQATQNMLSGLGAGNKNVSVQNKSLPFADLCQILSSQAGGAQVSAGNLDSVLSSLFGSSASTKFTTQSVLEAGLNYLNGYIGASNPQAASASTATGSAGLMQGLIGGLGIGSSSSHPGQGSSTKPQSGMLGFFSGLSGIGKPGTHAQQQPTTPSPLAPANMNGPQTSGSASVGPAVAGPGGTAAVAASPQTISHPSSSPKLDPDVGILITGCQDSETSADVRPAGGKPYGAFTNALTSIVAGHFAKNPHQPLTYRNLVIGIRTALAQKKMTQSPTLECSQKWADTQFILV